jgi:hypothetical protein
MKNIKDTQQQDRTTKLQLHSAYGTFPAQRGSFHLDYNTGSNEWIHGSEEPKKCKTGVSGSFHLDYNTGSNEWIHDADVEHLYQARFTDQTGQQRSTNKPVINATSVVGGGQVLTYNANGDLV